MQLLQILDKTEFGRIWERGAGYLALEAVVLPPVVARKMGACDQEITVEMPGRNWAGDRRRL